MSAGEADELVIVLHECKVLLAAIDLRMGELTHRVERTEVFITMQQALRLAWRFQALLRRLGLPEDLDNAIRILNTFTRTVMYAYFASNLLMGTTLYNIGAGMIGMTVAAINLTSMVEGY